MDGRKIVFKQTGTVLIGLAVCLCIMLAFFALLGKFDMSVLWGGIAGSVLAALNFFFMAMGTCIAADKAEDQDVKGGQKVIRMSYIGRQAVLVVLLFVCLKSGLFQPFALLLPLVFVRPILTVAEFFKRKERDGVWN